MWAKFLNENDFLELRLGAFEEVKVKFQEIQSLLKRYEKELGADRVKEIRAEVKVEIGFQSGASVNPSNCSYYSGEVEATTSEPMPRYNDFSKNAEGTSAGLAGLGSHDALGGNSPITIVNRKTPNLKSNINIEGSPRKYGEDNDAAVELLDSTWATRMMKHRRAPDSHDQGGQRVFNCICGFKTKYKKYLLELHLKQKIFGRMFKCPYNDCKSSYGVNQFSLFKNHCMKCHQVQISNEAGCFMCGTQFKRHWELGEHDCPGTSKMDTAMEIQN